MLVRVKEYIENHLKNIGRVDALLLEHLTVIKENFLSLLTLNLGQIAIIQNEWTNLMDSC